ncbi:MAG: sodium:solute symporter family protein [Brevinema sp.]
MLILYAFMTYIIGVILLSWFLTRKQQTASNYLIGGKALGLVLLLGTNIATVIGTGSSMGAVGNAYFNGWGGALYGIGGTIGLIIFAFTLAKGRNQGFVTMTEEFASYYENNKTLKIMVTIILILAEVGWTGSHLLGGSLYLHYIVGIDLNIARFIMMILFSGAILVGGLLALAWSDTIQAVVLFIGFLLLTYLSIPVAGGWEHIINTLPKESLSFLGYQQTGMIPAFSLMMVMVVNILSTPVYRQRAFSAVNYNQAKNSFLITAGCYFIFAFFPVIIGMAAYTIDPTITNGGLVFPYMATQVFPPLIGALVLIAGMSATVSSGDSEAMAAVTITIRDFIPLLTGKIIPKEKMIVYSRIVSVILVFLAYIFVLFATDLLGYIQSMVSTLLTGIVIVGLLGRYWKRATWQGAIASLVISLSVSLMVNNHKDLLTFFGNSVIPALISALIAHVLVSLCSPRPIKTHQEIELELAKERELMGL